MNESVKEHLGYTAAHTIMNGMIVGLGSGSTAQYFIRALGARIKQEGLLIQGIASSCASEYLAREVGIPLLSSDALFSIDLTVDGADRVIPGPVVIKGMGGAHLREKIIAYSSARCILLIDESKYKTSCAGAILPVEVLPFCYLHTIQQIERLGYQGSMRTRGHELFHTDNGNYLFDMKIPEDHDDPRIDHQRLLRIPGVCDTGCFFDLALEIWVGYKEGIIVRL